MKKLTFLSIATVAVFSLALIFALPSGANAQTSVVCPVGYICTPITPPTTPVCPTGFICTPISSTTTIPVDVPPTVPDYSSCSMAFTTNLTVGSSGQDVLRLQKFLNSSGFPVGVTGYFGQYTKAALSRYQASAGLPVTGALDVLTRAKINGNCPVPTTPILNLTSKSLPTFSGSSAIVEYDATYDSTKIDPAYVTLSLYCPSYSVTANSGGKNLCGGSINMSQVRDGLLTTTVQLTNTSGQAQTIGAVAQAYSYSGPIYGASDKDAFNLQPTIGTTTPPGSNIVILNPRGGEVWPSAPRVTDTISGFESYRKDITWMGVSDSPEMDYRTPGVQAYLEQYMSGQYVTIGRIPPFAYGSIAWVVGVVGKADCQMIYPSSISNSCFNTTNMQVVPAGQYNIRLVDARTGSWGRSGNFTITSSSTNQSSVQVTSPNGGENWTRGSIQNITWNYTPIPSICVSGTNCPSYAIQRFDLYMTSAGCNYPYTCMTAPQKIASNVVGGSYPWKVGSLEVLATTNSTESSSLIGPVYATQAKIMVCTAGSLNYCDSSDSAFTISSGGTQSGVQVMSPNGGETWNLGTMQTIKWQGGLIPTCPPGAYCTLNSIALQTYDIKLVSYVEPCTSRICPMYSMPIYAPYTIASGVRGTSYLWSTGLYTIPEKYGSPSSYVNPGKYKIQVCVSGTSTCDDSDSSFMVTASGTQPYSFSVTYPTAGTVFQSGQTYSIKWTSPDPLGSSYAVYLIGGNLGSTGSRYIGSAVSTGSQYTDGTGSVGAFPWTVPTDIMSASNYQIQFSGRGASGGNSQIFAISSSNTTQQPITIPLNGTLDLSSTFPSVSTPFCPDTDYVRTQKVTAFSVPVNIVANTGVWADDYLRINGQSFGTFRYDVNCTQKRTSAPSVIATGTVMMTIPAGTPITIEDVDTVGVGASATGILSFVPSSGSTINSPITVTSPVNGQTVSLGESINVAWNSASPLQPVDVRILNSAGQVLPAPAQLNLAPYSASAQSIGFATAVTGSLSLPLGQYRARVCSAGTTNCADSGVFSIVSPVANVSPYISYTTPQSVSVNSTLTVYVSNAGRKGNIVLQTMDGSKTWTTGYANDITGLGGFSLYNGSSMSFTVPINIGRGVNPGMWNEPIVPITTGSYNLYVTSLDSSNNFIKSNVVTVQIVATTQTYPGFSINFSKPSYSPTEHIYATVNRADGKTTPYPVDVYIMNSSTGAKVLKWGNTPIGYNSTFDFTVSDFQNIYTGAGSYSLALCDAGKTCVGGVNTNSALFDIAASSAALNASCTGSALTTTAPGISWTATATGGQAPYRYSWSVYNDVTNYTGGSTASSAFSASYATAGTKEAVVRVTEASGSSASAVCSVTIPTAPTPTVTYPTISNMRVNYGTLVVPPNAGPATQQFSFVATITAGTSPLNISKNVADVLATTNSNSNNVLINLLNWSDDNTAGDTAQYFYVAPGQSKTFTATYAAAASTTATTIYQVTAFNTILVSPGTGYSISSADVQNNLKAILNLPGSSSLSASVWDAVRFFFGAR